MAQSQDLEKMLNQLNRPAFLAENGGVTAVNDGAAKRMVEAGAQVIRMIRKGKEEYEQFQGEGSLYLTVGFGDLEHSATVTYIEDKQLFVLNDEADRAELQALCLAAGQLSMPLSEISVILEQLSEIDPAQKAKIIKNLYRIQRIVGNMSDAVQLQNAEPKMQLCELGSLFSEILEKAQSLLSHSNIQIEYRLPEVPIFAPANEELITRAVYNMISNAAKFAPAAKTIQVQMSRQKDKLYFTVIDSGSGIEYSQLGNVFQRYSRQPGLEDPRYGLGVGLTLVHSVAAAHGGTVLVEKNQPQGTKITMTLSLKKDRKTELRSPILKPDIYGGQDQALIELSDVLPYQLYVNE